jgi:hypothetical protein
MLRGIMIGPVDYMLCMWLIGAIIFTDELLSLHVRRVSGEESLTEGREGRGHIGQGVTGIGSHELLSFRPRKGARSYVML